VGLLTGPLGRFLPRLPRRAFRTAGFLLPCQNPPRGLILALLSADQDVINSRVVRQRMRGGREDAYGYVGGFGGRPGGHTRDDRWPAARGNDASIAESVPDYIIERILVLLFHIIVPL
jgi:hypothetical protein